MAYKDSGALAPSADYTLGDYTFQLRSNYDGDEDVTGIVARMTKDGQTSVKGIDVEGQATVESWSVEANESEATVYAVVNVPANRLTTGTLNKVSLSGVTTVGERKVGGQVAVTYNLECFADSIATIVGSTVIIATTSDPYRIAHLGYSNTGGGGGGTWYDNFPFTYKNKTVHYTFISKTAYGNETFNLNVIPESEVTPASRFDYIAWDLIYGANETEKEQELLIGRFSIDIHEAGGNAGGDEDWEDPVDYEEGWEEGDPTHTLKVSIKGATSGRHNDPLNDPSYSYLPADNTTQKAYGCGGDGGYGGGGGAGASTVIVYKFATDKANSKEVTAIARGHGYGSGGGKGGKGGDGCIIVYY